MPRIKRLSFVLALSLFALLTAARAQTPQVSTVNITPDADKVRVSAAGDVLEMRVAVSDEAGDVVFESGPVAGGSLEWATRGDGGARVPPGAYTLSVTYRASNGKLKRRVEQVLVTEEVTSAAAQQESAAPTPAASVEGAGTAGRIAKFMTATTVGNSVMFESSGKVGFGTTAPQQSLHAVGPSSRLRLQSTNGPALTTTEFVTNGRVWQSGAAGSTAAGGVANKFFVLDQTAGQYRLVIDPAGNVGVGTSTPASKLTVNGMLQITGPTTNGIRFADGSIQTKATAGTINGTGTTNRLTKFTGPNSFGNSTVTEASGRVGIGTASPAVGLHVGAGVPGGQAQLRLDNSNGQSGSLNRWTNRIELTSSDTIELSAGGISRQHLWIEPTGLARFGDRLWIMPSGKIGIGTSSPAAPLHVVGPASHLGSVVFGLASSSESFGVGGQNTAGGAGMFGGSNTGDGVRGVTSSNTLGSPAAGVRGENTQGGWAGYFQGPVRVTGTFDNSSDRNQKANVSAVDPRSVLRKLAGIPIHTWNYKAEPSSIRHLGPMAQDFRAAFGLGTGDTTISAVDADGVALASIQALYQLLQEKDRQIELQGRQLAEVRARLARVERAAGKRRTARRGR